VAGDIFVCASKSETQGMIITEAMYMGLPIVAVKAPGINSLVENGRNGILVTEDKNEFILAVEKLIGDENLRKKMGEESAKIAREKYTSKICADKMLEVYKNAIRENDTTNKA
jgi:glycosyltransferase involved in cell wall biosynthesis